MGTNTVCEILPPGKPNAAMDYRSTHYRSTLADH
jgi:hypothetical protein